MLPVEAPEAYMCGKCRTILGEHNEKVIFLPPKN